MKIEYITADADLSQVIFTVNELIDQYKIDRNTRPLEDALEAENATLKRRLDEIVEYTSTVYDEPPSVDQLIYDTACIHLIATGEMDKLTEGKDDLVADASRATGGGVMCRIEAKNNPHAFIEWMYPELNNRRGVQSTITINLYHVRAADGIRIKYDGDRDGWVIEQASVFEWDCDDEVMDEDWQEVAFAQAWARAKDMDI